MKLCIVVYGNIASGKSSFTKLLLEQLPNFRYVCLDDFRLKCQSRQDLYPLQREKMAEQLCLSALAKSNFVLFETTGGSRFWQKVCNELDKTGFATLYVKIDCTILTCLKRFNDRKHQGHIAVTPPYKGKTLVETLYQIERNQKSVPIDFLLSSSDMQPTQMVDLCIDFMSKSSIVSTT